MAEERQRRPPVPLPAGQRPPTRVVIRHVSPEVDEGRYAVKRTLGERVVVEADIFTDGHDALACLVLHRRHDTSTWTEVEMRPQGNDRWRGEFTVSELTRYCYAVTGWVDRFQTWSRDLAKRLEAGQAVDLELQAGLRLVE